MSKKTNTIIFVVIGTIVNVILAIIFVVALLVIASWAKDFIGNAKSAILPFIVFLPSLSASFFLLQFFSIERTEKSVLLLQVSSLSIFKKRGDTESERQTVIKKGDR